jgi:hypothetical protein
MMRCVFIILLLCTQSIWAEEPIGRLFTTPTERSNLEYLRQTKKNIPTKPEIPAEEIPITDAAPISLPDAINMQGYVKRNDGKKGTVWINNNALQENSSNKEVQVGSLPSNGNRVPIKLPSNGKYLTLKAGQVYDPESNRVRESRSHGAQGDAITNGRIGNEETHQ